MMIQELARSSENAPPASPSSQRDAMSADDVAEFLDVDRKSVYAAATRNEIPHRRLGKRILFSRAALALWLRGTCKLSSESNLR
jgi:excisionase family DNA binding protein